MYKEEITMNRFLPVWILWGSLAVAALCGMVSAVRGRRMRHMRRMLRRGGKMLSRMSSVMLDVFS